MITGISQGICTLQKIDKNIGKAYYLTLLWLLVYNAPLQII